MANLILIGFMGSGKTSLGKQLAKKLDLQFIDSDQLIEAEQELSIGQLFAEKGEMHFRELEKVFIHKLFQYDRPFVLATGGGMPCYGNAMELLNELGTTFYLQRSPRELTQRLINAKQVRPLVAGMEEQELSEYIQHKLKEREDHYRMAKVILEREQQEWQTISELFRQLHPSHSIQKS